MEVKGIVASRLGSWQWAAGLRRATIPFSSISRFSLLQIDVEVEEPETLANPTQSLEIHNFIRKRTRKLWAVIIYIL